MKIARPLILCAYLVVVGFRDSCGTWRDCLLLSGFIASAIAGGKGRSGCGGFAIGFLLGPLGIVWALSYVQK